MKIYKTNVKVPIQVSWEQDLVEDADNFYMRLIPHVNTGAAGTARLKRVTTATGEARYKTVKQINYENKVEELKKKIVEDQKKDIKKMVVDAVKGKNPTVAVETPTPSAPSSKLDIERMLRELSKEDFEQGGYTRGEGEDKRIITTGFSEKEIEQLTKNKG